MLSLLDDGVIVHVFFELAVVSRVTEPLAPTATRAFVVKAEVDGTEAKLYETTKVSDVVVDVLKLSGTATVTVSPVAEVEATAIEPIVKVPALAYPPAPAEAGATEVNTPSPNADTATSAIRLIVVFVDIDFLSVVDLETFSRSAWVEINPPA